MRFLARLFIVCLVFAAVAGQAATTGIAYDLVTKTGVGTDPGSYTPAGFEADVIGALNQAAKREAAEANTARNAQTIAVRMYITPSKQRTDYPMSNTAAIVDCNAQTLTTLDFAAKTYVVRSLDALEEFPSPGFPGPEMPKSKVSDYSQTVDTRALGRRRMEDIEAEGYETTSRFSSPVPSGTVTSIDVTTRYYSNAALPASRCAGKGPYSDGYRSYLWRFSATVSSRVDPNYSNASNPHIKISGLTSVPGRLPLLTIVRSRMVLPNPVPNSVSGNETAAIVEAGHIRRISSDDPIFAIPSGFTPSEPQNRAGVRAHPRTGATAGIAYDQVTKIGDSADPTILTVASFEADFQSAARPSPVLNLTHVYITSSKGRKEDIAMGYAWIVDCDARTITSLNLSKKTYSVKSLAAARAEMAGYTQSFSSNGVTLKRKALTRALGPRRLGKISAPAYETTLSQTIEVTGGPATSMELVVDSYFSNLGAPHLSCSGEALGYAPEEFFLAQFPNVEMSGIALPDRLALFTTRRLTREFAGAGGGAGGQAATEIGHIRTISSDDAIFEVPPDFKAQ